MIAIPSTQARRRGRFSVTVHFGPYVFLMPRAFWLMERPAFKPKRKFYNTYRGRRRRRCA